MITPMKKTKVRFQISPNVIQGNFKIFFLLRYTRNFAKNLDLEAKNPLTLLNFVTKLCVKTNSHFNRKKNAKNQQDEQ